MVCWEEILPSPYPVLPYSMTQYTNNFTKMLQLLWVLMSPRTHSFGENMIEIPETILR